MKKYNNYISIGELSKLTDVHIKSLRYYNEIGILMPVFIDCETKYRYYSYSQIQLVYAIQFYVDLGIPLKELHAFIDPETQTINLKNQINHGIRVAEEKIINLKNKIEIAKSLSHKLDRSQSVVTSNTPIELNFPEKHCWLTPYTGKLTENEYNTIVGNLLLELKNSGYEPVCEMGILNFYSNSKIEKYIFVDIDPSFKEAIDNPNYFYLPARSYMCHQIEFDELENAPTYFSDLFKSYFTKVVICSELFVENLNYAKPTFSLRCTVQKP